MNKPELTQAAIKYFREKGFPPHDHEQQQAESYAEFFIEQSKSLHDRIRELEEVLKESFEYINDGFQISRRRVSTATKLVAKIKKLINPK